MSDAKLNREKNLEAHAAIVAARKARKTQKSSHINANAGASKLPVRMKAIDQSCLHALYAFCKRVREGNFRSKHPLEVVRESREYKMAVIYHGNASAIARVRQIFPEFSN